MLEVMRRSANSQETVCNFADLALLSGVQTFGGYLREAIRGARLTKTAFADQARISKSFVSDLIANRRTPPLEDVERWADVLSLRGAARERLLDLAVIAHVPGQGRDRFLRFLDMMDRYQRELAADEADDGD